MAELQKIDGSNWREFVGSERAVLVLGRSDCEACEAYSEELEEFLAEDHQWGDVVFGKMTIDQPGLASFKKEASWLSEVRDLPYTVIYVEGELEKRFAGNGIERLTNRLERIEGDGGKDLYT